MVSFGLRVWSPPVPVCMCVCVFVCVSHNSHLVHAIISPQFKVESQNLDHQWRRHWFRSLLSWRLIDLTFKMQLHFKPTLTLCWACLHDNLPLIEFRIARFEPKCILALLRYLLFCASLTLPFNFMFNFNIYFSNKLSFSYLVQLFVYV